MHSGFTGVTITPAVTGNGYLWHRSNESICAATLLDLLTPTVKDGRLSKDSLDQFTVGAAVMRSTIAEWHAKQGHDFAILAERLERLKADPQDILRTRWAAASHSAHASAIHRMAIPASP